MKKEITIANQKCIFVDDCYEGKFRIWGKDTKIFIDIIENKDIQNIVVEKIEWVNKNRKVIVEIFMQENAHYVDVVNEMVERGEFITKKSITKEDFMSSLFVEYLNIWVCGNDSSFSIDLNAEPDYLLGHLANMEIDKNYKVQFASING